MIFYDIVIGGLNAYIITLHKTDAIILQILIIYVWVSHFQVFEFYLLDDQVPKNVNLLT